MNSEKIKSYFLMFFVTALLAVFCAGFFFANGLHASAETPDYAKKGMNFIYSTEFSPEVALADFARDFSDATNGDSNAWEYGYATGYDFDADTFTFTKCANKATDEWNTGDGITIKSDWFQNEKDGAQATVRYTMPETKRVTVAVNFTGTNAEETRIAGRLNIARADGSVQSCDYIYDASSNVWSKSVTVDVEKGAKISILFFNEGSGWPQGKFNLTVTEVSQIAFGADEDSRYIAEADSVMNKLSLKDAENKTLKEVSGKLPSEGNFKLTLVVNEGVAKLFVGSENVAALVCALDDYKGGGVGVVCGNSVKQTFTSTDTPDGNIYVGGYTVLKVANITDGNYLLKEGEYTVEGGVITVKEDYLKTLEAGKDYRFRAVTSFTDFDFTIHTDFTAVTATPSVDKYYRDNDVTIELSGNVEVDRLLIDGKECKFTQNGDKIVIASEELSSLTTGKHSVKLYTDKGRPETSITISELVETITEPIEKATHLFLWIDLAIFGTAIVGYLAYSVISKRKGN